MHKDVNKTKLNILNTAAKLFAKNGYNATSMNDIASHVKIEKSSLYYFYKNKDDIFAAVLERSWDKLLNDIQKALANTKSKDLSIHLNKVIEVIITSGLKSGLTIIDINSPQIMKRQSCEIVFRQIIHIKNLIINLLKAIKVKQAEVAQEIIMNAIHAYVIHAQHHKQATKPTAYAAYLTKLFI